MKFDKLTIIRVAGLAASVIGTVALNWVGKKDADNTLAKLVEEKLQNK